MGISYARLENKPIPMLALRIIPKETAEKLKVIPYYKDAALLKIGAVNPQDPAIAKFAQDLQASYQTKVNVDLISDASFAFGLNEYDYLPPEDQGKKLAISEEQLEKLTKEISDFRDIGTMAHRTSLSELLNLIFAAALKTNASDIHFQPEAQEVVVRFRVDGLLQKVVTLPRDILSAIVARLKLMSNLKIDEHRQAQDGRFHYKIGERGLDVRVSAIPTLHGTKMVLRLLDESKKRLSLRRLGLNSQHLDILTKEIKKPYGMILVTGPTGSGKTTTLYTLLRTLNSPEVNIWTVEDPIEFGLEGVNQTQVSKSGGITFATGLKSLLRQDPNILMVGEIRDAETANIAMNAAMTGHLVLSTLHTNNVFLVPQRLIEMGVEPYLAASVINLIIGQRLVRQICDHCRSLGNWQSKKFDKFRSSFDLPKAFKKFKPGADLDRLFLQLTSGT